MPLTGLRAPRELPTEHARVVMRVLVVAREQMTCERTRTINALTALVRTFAADLAGNRADITKLIDQDAPQLLELTSA
ncbi:MAG: hypothetical protein ACXVGA_02170 [Mycobacteriaceae bacterium]